MDNVHDLFAHGERDHFYESPQFKIVSSVNDNGDTVEEVKELSFEEKSSPLGSSAFVDSFQQDKVAPVDYHSKFQKMDTLREDIDTLNEVDV